MGSRWTSVSGDDSVTIAAFSLNHIGDVLFTEPALYALKAGYPQGQLVVITSAAGAEVLRCQPYVDQVLCRRRGFWGFLDLLVTVRRLKPDIAVAFSPSSLAIGAAVRLSGARLTAGFNARPIMSRLFTKSLPFHKDRHIVEDNLALVELVGGKRLRHLPQLFSTQQEISWSDRWLSEQGLSQYNLIGCQPFASTQKRLWDMSQWARFLLKLSHLSNYRVIIFGGQEVRKEGERLSRETGAINAAGSLTVRQFIAVVRRCFAFVGLDSGPTHLAAAAGVPTLVLYGPATRGPVRAGPLGTVVAALSGEKNTWNGMTPEKVWSALTDLIEKHRIDSRLDTNRLTPSSRTVDGLSKVLRRR
ncbi:MAG: glycosyltransferase family 9 protein [Armatimonadetes bacterium]|nr:glycosyltransferase family 9 protein [Armatimonadota bacterium]MDW8120697.1 glycosyltransferase family 9 protein [Armatimonadota bacterium]